MNGHDQAIDVQILEAIDRERAEADELQDYYRVPMSRENQLFIDFCTGKLTKEEYERESETTQSVEQGTVGVLATEPDNNL